MSVNKVILVGRLGQNPEVRFTPGGAAVANFSIATSESWNDKSGQRQEKTEWHRIVAWGKLAELCQQYLSKGRQVYIEGRLQTRQWQDQSGQTKYTTEINAQTVQFLGGASTGAGAGAGASAGGMPEYDAPTQQFGGANQNAQFNSNFNSNLNSTSAPAEPSFTEDDIPF